MGTTITSAANGNIALAPSDSATETAAQVTAFTDASQPQAVRDLWTGARYRVADIPVGEEYSEYKWDTASSSMIRIDSEATIDNLKRKARIVHDYYDSLSQRLEGREAILWRAAVVAKAHDIIAEMHRATFIIIGKKTTSLDSLTVQQRMDWCDQVLLGPSDIRSYNPLTQIKERVHAVYEAISPDSFAAPTAPFTYIDPRTGNHINLADVVNLCVGTDSFTPIDGTSPGDDITGLGLESVTDFTGVDVDASWIDDVAA